MNALKQNPVREKEEKTNGTDTSDSESSDEEKTENIPINDVTQLSDTIFMYPNKMISDHGNVFEGEVRSGVYGVRVCAIKIAQKSEQNVKEAKILARLGSHTHIISIIQSGICKDMFEERVYIALDKCHEQNLEQYLIDKKESGIEFDLNEALEYSKQIIFGVTYVHENLIIHKDLKPSNILLSHDKSTIKLADFGISQEIKTRISKLYSKYQFGTNGYRPPESFGDDWVSPKSDIFSLGVVLCFVLSNAKSPFGDDITLWIDKAQKGEINLSNLLVPNTRAFAHLLTLMLSKDRCRRPSIWQVSSHPCWAGIYVECNFDYGYEEEVADCNVDIPVPEKEDASNIQSKLEGRRELFRALEKLGFNTSPKSETSIIILDGTSEHLHRWKPISKSMTQIHKFNEEMKKGGYFTSVSIGNHIYVLMKRSLYRLKYGDVTATWETMNGLDDGRHGLWPPAVVHSGMIYVVGSGSLLSKSVSKYDPSMDQWEELKDKELKTEGSAVVASKDFIYCIGGGVIGLDATERLNVVSQTWVEVAPMNEKRGAASAAEYNEKIVVAGGWGVGGVVLNSVEQYDPDLNQWTIMKPMMKRRRRLRLHSIEGDLFAVGNYRSDRTIEKYDSSNDQWEITDLGSEMRICESVSVKNYYELK